MESVVRHRLGRFGFAADYNPEQWPESVWDEDVALMRTAGVSMVSVGIFGWAVTEPVPGEYDFALLDRVMELLSANGIGACLATMTASPPPWRAHRFPETLPRRADGTVLWPGARQHYRPSSPVYLAHATRLVEAIATRCGSVAALNDAWSTTFWSQRYSGFAEVHPPRTAPTFLNPAQVLDHKPAEVDLAHYRPLWNAEVVVDVVAPTVDLARYRLVVVPNLYAFGDGVATYLATRPDAATPASVVARVLDDAGVSPVLPGAPAGVEAVRRGGWLFLLNHNENEVTVPVPAGAADALSGEPLLSLVRLAGRGELVAHAASPGHAPAAAGT